MTENGEAIALATIYNAVRCFSQAGLIREVTLEQGRSLYDNNTDHHHHIYDEEKGILVDIPALNLSQYPAIESGQEISRIDIVVRVRQAKQKKLNKA